MQICSVTKPREPWNETVEQYGTKLKQSAAYINAEYDVEGLCNELLERVQMLNDREGDRIPK